MGLFNWGKRTVIIKDLGDKKANVVKAVKSATGWDLKKSLEFIFFLPAKLPPMDKEEALLLKKDLESAGATVIIK